MDLETLAAEVKRLSKELRKLKDHQEISDLISRYGWLHDRLMVGPSPTPTQAAQFEIDALEWEGLFTDDVEAVYTLTTTHGNKGFADVFR